MPNRIVRNPTEARAGSVEGVVRYILIISTTLVVILFVLSYAFS
jgi:hypothetical protein